MVEKVRKAIEPLYTDRCRVYEKRVKEGVRTCFERVVRYESIPCRVSSKSYLFGESASSERGNLLKVSKRVRIFLPPEYVIEPGSEIEIVRGGKKKLYGRSGEMNFYQAHNEVMVEIVKSYA